MKKVAFSFLSILLIGAFVVPQGAHALSALQIESILGLLRAFDADDSVVQNVSSTLQGNTGVSTSSIEYKDTLQLSRNLSRGMKGSDIERLQRYLRSTGDYKEDITGYYGVRTEEAVKSWQSRTGVVRSGTPSTTGYGNVGPSTRTALTNAARTAVVVTPDIPDETRGVETFTPDVQLPDETGGVETGNIDAGAKFAASPTLGGAPLTVTFSTNLEQFSGLQGGGSIQLDYGDGNVIILCKPGVSGVSACTQEWSYPTYTYRQGGTYNAKLLRQPESGSSSVLGTVSITVSTSTLPDETGGVDFYTPPVTPTIPDETPGIIVVPPITLSVGSSVAKVLKGEKVKFFWYSQDAKECKGTFSDGYTSDKYSLDSLNISFSRVVNKDVTLSVTCTNGPVRSSGSITVKVEDITSVIVAGAEYFKIHDPEVVIDPVLGNLMYFVAGVTLDTPEGIYMSSSCAQGTRFCSNAIKVVDTKALGFTGVNSPTLVTLNDAGGGSAYYIMYFSGTKSGTGRQQPEIYYATSWVGDGVNWSEPRVLLSGYSHPEAVRDFKADFASPGQGEVTLFATDTSNRPVFFNMSMTGVDATGPKQMGLREYTGLDVTLQCDNRCYYSLYAQASDGVEIGHFYSNGATPEDAKGNWARAGSVRPIGNERYVNSPTHYRHAYGYTNQNLFYSDGYGYVRTRVVSSNSFAQSFLGKFAEALNRGVQSIASVFGSLFGR